MALRIHYNYNMCKAKRQLACKSNYLYTPTNQRKLETIKKVYKSRQRDKKMQIRYPALLQVCTESIRFTILLKTEHGILFLALNRQTAKNTTQVQMDSHTTIIMIINK